MRKKLILLMLLIILALLFILNERKNIVFVGAENVNVYTDEDITEVDNILLNLFNDGDLEIAGIEKKYQVVSREETQYCDKENTMLISRERNYKVISNEEGNDYSFYKENNGRCELIGKIENVNFTEKIVSTYANGSIYTNFESLNDFEISGMVRVKKDEVVPFGSFQTRYTNPTAFPDGVLMIENNKNVVAFDNNDKATTKQNNDSNNRNVLAINLVDRSLFMLVKNGNQYTLEGYDVNDEESIKKIDPKLTYDVSEFLKSLDITSAEITTRSSSTYGSFTTAGSTIIISADFSDLFLLNNADTTLDITDDIAFLRNSEIFYVLDLQKRESEPLGSIRALSFKVDGSSVFFTALDDKSNEVYIKFRIR